MYFHMYKYMQQREANISFLIISMVDTMVHKSCLAGYLKSVSQDCKSVFSQICPIFESEYCVTGFANLLCFALNLELVSNSRYWSQKCCVKIFTIFDFRYHKVLEGGGPEQQ